MIPPDGLILEGLVTTLDPREREGDEPRVNIAPMGPIVTARMDALVLRPFTSSRTYRNLRHHHEGVFHVTDDVEVLARAAVGEVAAPMEKARRVDGYFLTGACRFYEFRVLEVDDLRERAELRAEVVHEERLREFLGFNRARHAVLEAAILATRTAFLPLDEVLERYRELEVLVHKTGGEREHCAFAFLRHHVERERRERAPGNVAP